MDNQSKRPEDFPVGYHKSKTFGEASRHAWNGLKMAFASERNLKIQAVIYVLVIALAIVVQLSFLEIAVIILTAAIVMALEMVNTTVEHFANVVEPQYSETVGRIKDFTAGAVLLVSAAAVIIGLLLFIPPLFLGLTS